tara:strand:- start:31537 stop:33600 length:2064 start_codon:yes stop_codon:yes gene_type:complete
MGKIFFLFVNLFSLSNLLISQINPEDIDIIRDKFGVPHIFAKTDSEVAYGLAWAHAEDDFKTIQIGYLAGNNLLSKYLGNKGLGADFVTQFIGSEELFDKKYMSDITPEYKIIVKSYAEALNRYAELNPDEVLITELFPITEKKMLRYAQLQLFVSSKGDMWVSKIISNNISTKIDKTENYIGSNMFAFNSQKTTDGDTYFAINTHQPLDGPVSWYEAHLCSEEGTNILGALFAGSPNILIGTNENLAWTHTVNEPDKTDVFVLEMHPKDKLKYRVDEKYLSLIEKKAILRYNLFGIPIRIKKKYYKSIYGPTLKNKSGFYAVRTPALFEIRALNQWWLMNKAKNFSEFYKILKMKALPGYNVGYADKNDTIFYMSNGLIPKREKGYNWAHVVPGNTRKTLWTQNYDIEDLPQVLQPKSGYFYNANHTPFHSSGSGDNPDPKKFDENMGFEKFDNNRSTRIKKLIDNHEKINYTNFKKIKYDRKYPIPYNFSWMNINHLENLDPKKYPDISDLIIRLQKWDRNADSNSLGAGTFAVFYNELRPYYKKLSGEKIFPPSFIINALRSTKKYLLKNFKTTEVMLGDYQKLVRGNKILPIFGLPDVITAMSSKPYKDGKVKVVSGESYIELIRFSKKGPEIESIISYGSSDRPDSEHYSDQMELYSKFKTKKMTLDKKQIYSNAEKIYHPK